MHDLNISGLATYVNSPEIYQANAHFSAPFPRGGFRPDRHVHERGARRGPDAPVSSRSQERCGRRLSRDQSPRPVPLARGSGLARKPRLDRGAESADRRLPRGHPRARLTKLWNYPKYGTPFRKGHRYFFFKNDGLQNQSVLYRQASLTADPETLLDPNLL